MDVGELLFRADQARQRVMEKTFPRTPAVKKVTARKVALRLDLHGFTSNHRFLIFGKELSLDSPLNFHEDIFSGKSFPLTFSKTIDMRTDRFGSAKAVWEVNRLQFLIPLLLHYKQTGERASLDRFVSIMQDWDRQNPYLKGLNWYSNIEVNIRLINWYWCWLILQDDEAWLKDPTFERFRNDTWLPLVYRHCYYSSRNPSLFSSANNHLVAEYTGLFMACSLWEFPESSRWLQQAKKGLEREILLQHSERGVNKEEADAYIQFITDFFLQSYIAGQHAGIVFSPAYLHRLSAIFTYINDLLDIRNNIPGYGDNDDGRVIMPDGKLSTNNFVSLLNTAAVLFHRPELKREAAGWDIKSALLTSHVEGREAWQALSYKDGMTGSAFYSQEGHFLLKKRWNAEREFYCHFDAAPLGYLSIAAHGHADALSVIVHVNGYPFLVDPGTYAYHTHQEWRKYFTSTLAHNTVTIDGLDQAIMAGPTLWLDHYRTEVLQAESLPERDLVSASHDGYKKRGFSHRRSLDLDKTNGILSIKDELQGEKPGFRVNLPFHLHPQIIVLRKAPNIYLLRHPASADGLEISFDPSLSVEQVAASDNQVLGWYSDGFMKKEKSTVLMGQIIPDQKSITFNTIIKLTAQS